MLSEWLSIYQCLDRRNRIEMTRIIFKYLVYRKHQKLFSEIVLFELCHPTFTSLFNFVRFNMFARKH